ncbi:MAG: putative ABC transporter ATP-binding protein [Candidatus Heimdallarchaeota archaeon LC_3]|nr:MAG: putative ABC transporter ATP-binding protein [Candidatus Heimdallarchaeota archaeon LC_3]
MNFLVEITNLVKVYGQGKTEAALEGVSATFLKGILNIVVGPSGSGKTTLLNCIGGLLRPTSGKISIENFLLSNASINELLYHRRFTVGIIFQDYNLIPGLTCEENIFLPGSFKYKSRNSLKEASDSLLKELDIYDLRKIDVSHLSGGERQRVSIATALINDPPILLADEPTGQLDTNNTEKVITILKRKAQEGKCVIVSTHDPRVVKHGEKIFKLNRKELKISKDISESFHFN